MSASAPADRPASDRPFYNDTIATLEARVSVRQYADRPVSDDMVDAILQAAFRAPTSSNIQAYSVVVVRDRERLQALSVPTGNQRHVAETPVFLAFCADLTRMHQALEKHGHSLEDNNLEMGLVSSVDATLVGMSAYLVADTLGLKGVMIGGVRNDPRAIARILGLPKRVYCVFGMCLGWPSEAPQQKPRMDADGVVHREQYEAAAALGAIDDYDRALALHYQSLGKETAPDSWSHEVDAKFKVQPREGLREALAELGFGFR